jgi:general secretion pathway protein E
VSREFLLHHRLCPSEFDSDGRLIVAAAPGALLNAVEDICLAYRTRVTIEPAPYPEVERLIERLTTEADRRIELAVNAGASVEDPGDLAADVRDLATQPPVIRYVNLLVRDAADMGASDIHLETARSGLTVRFRLDGVLIPAPEPPADLQHAIISRLKLLAELDIAERRRPQDGRICVRMEARNLDLRVATIPTLAGESVVLRLLDRGERPVTLSGLGMPESVLAQMSRLSLRPHGMILVTGPTGSGKTTTLYAVLQQRQATREKIITLEDPVEYQLPGITQMPVHASAGVTFGSALRSILRQDPDVIMVGEMRDFETAELAIQAALTGHLVLSTLHTTDAIGAIPRLLDLGAPGYLVAATLDGILAQRLVRRICTDCSVEYQPSQQQAEIVAGRPVGAVTLARGRGCESCRGTGYRGRVGIFELMIVDDAIRTAIMHGAHRSELLDLATELRSARPAAVPMVPLLTDGWAKAEAGITTVEEVLRVVQE